MTVIWHCFMKDSFWIYLLHPVYMKYVIFKFGNILCYSCVRVPSTEPQPAVRGWAASQWVIKTTAAAAVTCGTPEENKAWCRTEAEAAGRPPTVPSDEYYPLSLSGSMCRCVDVLMGASACFSSVRQELWGVGLWLLDINVKTSHALFVNKKCILYTSNMVLFPVISLLIESSWVQFGVNMVAENDLTLFFFCFVFL